MSYYQAVSGNLLACLPLELRLRGKSTTQSHRGAIYFVDLSIREGMTLEAAVTEAKLIDARRLDAGLHQEALDTAAKSGFANAAFEFSEEEAPEIIEEFYTKEAVSEENDHVPHIAPAVGGAPLLRDKPERPCTSGNAAAK